MPFPQLSNLLFQPGEIHLLVYSLQTENNFHRYQTSFHFFLHRLKNGKEIDATTLEDYLGAKAHMVVISLEDKEYLHVHPDVANGKFDLHTTFKKPGIYRGWIQFQAEGTVHTIDFTMNVTAGSAADIQKATTGHEATGTDHSNH